VELQVDVQPPRLDVTLFWDTKTLGCGIRGIQSSPAPALPCVSKTVWAVSTLKDSIHFRGPLNFGNLPNAPTDWFGRVRSRQVRKRFKQFEEGKGTLPGIAPHMTCDARAPSVAVLRAGSLNSWSRVGSNYGMITRHQSRLGPFTQRRDQTHNCDVTAELQ
jgi:hypothetical protein